MTSGHLDNPRATAESFTGGWFHSGGLGHTDADGYLFPTGRIKEIINRGGEMRTLPRSTDPLGFAQACAPGPNRSGAAATDSQPSAIPATCGALKGLPAALGSDVPARVAAQVLRTPQVCDQSRLFGSVVCAEVVEAARLLGPGLPFVSHWVHAPEAAGRADLDVGAGLRRGDEPQVGFPAVKWSAVDVVDYPAVSACRARDPAMHEGHYPVIDDLSVAVRADGELPVTQSLNIFGVKQDGQEKVPSLRGNPYDEFIRGRSIAVVTSPIGCPLVIVLPDVTVDDMFHNPDSNG